MRRTPTALAAASLLASLALAAGDDAWKVPARYQFVYRVPLGGVVAKGAHVSLWVPYPADTNDQKLLDAKIESPWPTRLTREKKYGNRMVYTEGTVAADARDFVLRVEVERRPSEGIPGGEGLTGTLSPALFRSPDRLVPLSATIRKIAEEESRGLKTDGEKVQAFYDYVYRTMTYNKDGAGWGRGDAVWACENKRGNCTDFHSLFIAMLRSQGIPARFLIGFPIPDSAEGDIGGYHCWAEFFDPKRGWVPVDASEAKKKGMKEAYFGALPNDRIEFAAGRDIVLEPPQKGEPVNYLVYPYAEIEGKPVEGLKGQFHFRRLAGGESS